MAYRNNCCFVTVFKPIIPQMITRTDRVWMYMLLVCYEQILQTYLLIKCHYTKLYYIEQNNTIIFSVLQIK